jgi:hypothetical protein
MGWFILFLIGSIFIAYLYGGLQTTFMNDKVGYAIGLVIGLIVMLFVIDELDNSGGDCVLGPEVCGDYYNP